MRTQKADDPALGMRQVWLGPRGMRWPFDATFTQWKVAAVLSGVSVVVLTLILPAAIPVAGLAWVAASLPGKFLLPDHRGRVTAGLVVAWLLLALLFVPSVTAWLTPMPLLVSLFFAPAVGVAITWRVGHFITPERPFAYWLALLPRTARGPRTGQERQFGTSALARPARASRDRTETEA